MKSAKCAPYFSFSAFMRDEAYFITASSEGACLRSLSRRSPSTANVKASSAF